MAVTGAQTAGAGTAPGKTATGQMRQGLSVMSDSLTEFLSARIDEDARIAQGIPDHSEPWDGRWMADGDRALRTYNGWVLATSGASEFTPGLTAHIARHDPARVLREVAAKRRLIERYERAVAVPESVSSFVRGQDSGYREACLDAIQDATTVYSDHPDYRQEWAP